jgi:hypothetical protein
MTGKPLVGLPDRKVEAENTRRLRTWSPLQNSVSYALGGWLVGIAIHPTARAVGCTLSPLRGLQYVSTCDNSQFQGFAFATSSLSIL